MSHADDRRDHPGPHPAIVARKLAESERQADMGNPISPDWRHPGPRYIAQAGLDPALAPGMTDLMVDPETLDAFMAANPLPDDLPPVEDVDWPEAEGNE